MPIGQIKGKNVSASILYLDNHLIAVSKPSRVLAQGDQTEDPDMGTAVKAFLKQRFQKPGNVYLGTVHRLDRPASGIMLFARTSKAATRMSKQFSQHLVKKEYICAVHNDTDNFVDMMGLRGEVSSIRPLKSGQYGSDGLDR